MENNDKRTLFFLKSPKHNLTAIENFLKKRDFNVVSISDYKEAVGKVIPLNPDYIFMAWDHPQEQVMNLPKLLKQSCTSRIIPYINSSDKHQHRKLQSSGFDIKLFPPLSGPGIQRMIAKIEQSAAAAEKANNEQDKKEKSGQNVSGKKSDMIQVRSTFSADQNDDGNQLKRGDGSAVENQRGSNALNRDGSTMVSTTRRSADENSMNRHDSRMLSDNQTDIVNRNESTLLGDDENPVRNRNESTLLDELQSDEAMFREKTRADQLRDFQKGLLNLRHQQNGKNANPAPGQADVVIQDRLVDPEAATTESLSALLNSGKLTEGQRSKINQSYLESVKVELQDYLGGYEDIKATYSDPSSSSTINIVNPNKHYCLVIQSSQWVGYLILSSEIPFERQSLEFILSKWVYENFGFADNQAEDLVNTSPLFEISLKPVSYLEFSQKSSDLTTTFEYNNQKMVLSFFNIEPKHIFLRLHEKFDMIKLGLAELPFEQNLDFDVCLYMPENDRFLTYSKKNSKIQKMHLDRLKDKKVINVYSSYENEVALQKFRAEIQMNLKIDDYIKGQKIHETA